MIRILTTEHAGATTITIDGELVGQYVDAVQNSVDAISGRKRHLFLRDVAQVDEQGRRLLVHLAGKGVELSASGLYTSYLVAEIRREVPRPVTAISSTMPKIST